MSEGNPNGQWHTPELNDLIRELEAQIESVNAGLSKIRGTVARISFAALGSTNPTPVSSWGSELHSAVAPAPANRNNWTPAPAPVEPVVASEPSPFVAPTSPAPIPFLAAEPVMPFVEHQEPATDPGFWTSVAEGASWPRAHTENLPAVPETAPDWPETPDQLEAKDPSEDAWTAAGIAADAVAASQAPEDRSEPVAEVVEPAAEVVPAWEQTEEAWKLDADAVAGKPSTLKELTSLEELTSSMPSSLSSGWPDESAWSQNFNAWPVAKPQAEPPAADAPSEASGAEDSDTRATVSDMVAQMRAELEAARNRGAPEDNWSGVPSAASDPESIEAASFETPAANDAEDDEAKRDEVSRAVSAIREQLEAGDFESVMRGNGYDDGGGLVAPEAFAASGETAEQEPLSEEEMRAEVRRAVEATREELSSGVEEAMHLPAKPAFKLAAPGSIPDWSHIQMEPSGPPVVVMKDADGRVELASVYETLNELGCGDGAALLNYTPHSVTVGLPIASKFPSKEQVAEAVEKVFGLTSRVESDGVRITVSIGVDPKKRSEDAA